MALNTALKLMIFERKTSQLEVAKRAKIHESRFSKIVRGHLEPTADEKKQIAKILRTTVDHLFGAEAVAS